jgi:hypothetical protein
MVVALGVPATSPAWSVDAQSAIFTIVLVKQGNEWLIAHHHSSLRPPPPAPK